MDEIKIGRYRHFKGNEYRVLHIAKHSETLEPMVVYQALYGERGIWVRPASMLEQFPTSEPKALRAAGTAYAEQSAALRRRNETVERDGQTYKRFEYIGE